MSLQNDGELIFEYAEVKFNHRVPRLRVCRRRRRRTANSSPSPSLNPSPKTEMQVREPNLRWNFRSRHTEMSHFLTKAPNIRLRRIDWSSFRSLGNHFFINELPSEIFVIHFFVNILPQPTLRCIFFTLMSDLVKSCPSLGVESQAGQN